MVITFVIAAALLIITPPALASETTTPDTTRGDLIPVLLIAAGAVYFSVDYILYKIKGRHLIVRLPARPVSFYDTVFLTLLVMALNVLLLLGYSTVHILDAFFSILIAYSIGWWVGKKTCVDESIGSRMAGTSTEEE